MIKLNRFMLSVKPQPFHFSLFQMQIYLSAVLFLPFFYERLSNWLHCKIKYSEIHQSKFVLRIEECPKQKKNLLGPICISFLW